MIHQELNSSSLSITDETPVCATTRLHAFWTHNKVSVVVIVMKRTTAGIVHASLAKFHEVAYNFNDARRIKNLIYYPSLYFRHIYLYLLFISYSIQCFQEVFCRYQITYFTPVFYEKYVRNIHLNVFVDSYL